MSTHQTELTSVRHDDVQVQLPKAKPTPHASEKNIPSLIVEDLHSPLPKKHKGGKNDAKHYSRIEHASLFSRLHFLFAIPLIKKGFCSKRNLKVEDLDPLSSRETAVNLERAFTSKYHYYSAKYPKSEHALFYVLCRLFWREAIIMAVCQCLNGVARCFMAYFLFLFVTALRTATETKHTVYMYGIGLFLSFILTCYASQQGQFTGMYLYDKVKAGVLGMLYRKIHKLSLLGIHAIKPGMMTSFISNDINSLKNLPVLVDLMCAPFIFIGGWGLMFKLWGWPSFVAFGYLLFVIILQYFFVVATKPIKHQKGPLTNSRVAKTLEMLEAIKQIKLYGWGEKYYNYITNIRNKEIAVTKKILLVDSIPRAFTMTCQFLPSFLMFLASSLTGPKLNPNLTFPSVMLNVYIKVLVDVQTFVGFPFINEFKAICEKVTSIMNLPEKDLNWACPPPVSKENAIELKEFTGHWVSPQVQSDALDKKHFTNKNVQDKGASSGATLPTEQAKTLKEEEYGMQAAIADINLDIKSGSLVTILGKVGSGKSSLLLSLSNEMQKTTGEVRVRGNFSYLEQESVLSCRCVREAVVFGKKYEENRFWKVLEVCGLAEYVKELPEADQTVIGTQNFIFSTERRAQLLLARTLYMKASIYLLDDQFCIFNKHLSHHIFNKAILEFLKGKTILMVTQDIEIAKLSDHVVILDNGKITSQGKYEKVFGESEFLKSLHHAHNDKSGVSGDDKDKPALLNRDLPSLQHVQPINNNVSADTEIEVLNETQADITLELPDKGLFSQDERLDDGKVDIKIYWKYFSAIFRWWNILPFLILLVASEAALYLFLNNMGNWAKQIYSYSKGAMVVGVISGGAIVIQFPKMIFYYNVVLNASNKFHAKILRGMIDSPMSFFDKNPAGRIITRFSTDMAMMDKFIVSGMLGFLENLASFIVLLFALWINTPQILVTGAALVVIYAIFYALCRKTLQAVRNLELSTKGPIHTYFLLHTRNMVTIRAHHRLKDALAAFYEKVDDHTRANIAYTNSVRFYSFIMDLFTQIACICTFCYLVEHRREPIAKNTFTIVLVLLPGSMQWVLQSLAELNILMSSPARIINFCERNKIAIAPKIQDKEIEEKKWPQRGEIKIQNATLRHSKDCPPLIKDLSLHVQPGHKVVITGKERLGMSSIIHLLARNFEIDPQVSTKEGPKESFVKIDDIDIRDVHIETLRKAITFIPQVPYLFTATIRDNLDPWKEHTEEQLWRVLDNVELSEFIKKLPHKLDTNLSRGSLVFSTGQKQLLCLARGLLRDSKVVAEDDSIQHVDVHTHRAVKKKLIEKYKDSTVIMITHRSMGTKHFDKVIVMGDSKSEKSDSTN